MTGTHIHTRVHYLERLPLHYSVTICTLLGEKFLQTTRRPERSGAPGQNEEEENKRTSAGYRGGGGGGGRGRGKRRWTEEPEPLPEREKVKRGRRRGKSGRARCGTP